jgi:ferritin
MFNAKVKELLNAQIGKEFYSAYLYLYFANYYEGEGLKGFANWFNVQAQEERDHAMLFRQYMLNNDLDIAFTAIDKPDVPLGTHMDALKGSLEHEQYITAEINTIYEAAYDAKDFRSMQFLDWFVKEQGEEEANATDLIKKMELFGSDSKGLYLMDQQMGTRVYMAPSLVL